MGAEIGQETADLNLAELEAELAKNPTAFEFFQAVLLLERLRPDREGVGRFVDPGREAIRFSSRRSIAFPPAEISALEIEPGGPSRMSVNVMGVTGPLGVLPYHYTLLGVERARARDTAYADFLDLFHHRMLSLFYRAWRKNRPMTTGPQSEDRLREHLLDLAGMGLEPLREDLGFDENALAYYSGLLSSQRRSAVAMEQLLEDYFGVPAEVEQFVGGWYPLVVDDQCALGEEDCASISLGAGAVVGDEIWEQQSRLRIRLGPLSHADFERFLPGGADHETLRAVARFYSNDEHEFELQLVLARQEVRGCVLGDSSGFSQPLGWSTWINTASFARDAEDTVLRL